MTNNYKLFIRLPTRFDEISKNTDVFNDCCLEFNNGDPIYCNRILLAKSSQWFEDYFNAHPKKGYEFSQANCVTVHIDQVEREYMELFINILKKNYLVVNVSNLPYLLKIAQVYKFPQISSILRTFYIDASQNDETLLYFAETFIKNDLVEDAIALAPMICKHFINIEFGEPDVFDITQIYKALSPPVFAAVLKQRYLDYPLEVKRREDEQREKDTRSQDRGELRKFNEDIYKKVENYRLQKAQAGDNLVVKYIEDYVKERGLQSLTEDDKEALANVFVSDNKNKIKDPIFYIYIIQYGCNWLPDRYLQSHINTIINRRRNCLRFFQRATATDGKSKVNFTDTDNTSRWYLMQWLKLLSDVSLLKINDVTVSLVEFIRTLGGSCKPFDPIKYGFIIMDPKNDCTPPLISSQKVENAFIQDPKYHYITGTGTNKTKPFFQFSLGKEAKFTPSKIFFDSRVLFKHNETVGSLEQFKHLSKNSRGLVNRFEVRSDDDRNPTVITYADPTEPCEVPFTSNDHPFSKLRFDINENDKGSDIVRLTTLEILGLFDLKS